MKRIFITILISLNSIIYSQTYKVKNSNQTVEIKELFAFNNGKTQIILDKNFSLPLNSSNWLFYHKKRQKLYRFENGFLVEINKTKREEQIKEIEKMIINAEKSVLDAQEIIKNIKIVK